MSFEVGDKVIDLKFGEGTVTKLKTEKTNYPIEACFMKFLSARYTIDGKSEIDHKYPMLFHVEGFTPPSCKEPERKPKCCNFKPFDKVLVRDSKEDEWTIELFSYYDPSATAPYRCLYEWWVYCIPYETNEDKCGKVTEE